MIVKGIKLKMAHSDYSLIKHIIKQIIFFLSSDRDLIHDLIPHHSNFI